MDQPEKIWGYKDIAKATHGILKHISFEYHMRLKTKIFLNSVIVVLPALIQFIFFDEPEYLLSFVLCFCFVSSAFLLSRARLIFTLPFVLLSFIYTFFLVMFKKSLGATSIMALMNTQKDVMFNFPVSQKLIPETILLMILFILYIRFILVKSKNDYKELLLAKNNRYIPITLMIATAVFFYFGYDFLIKAYPFSLSADSTTYVKIISQMKKTAETRYHFDGKFEEGFKAKRRTFILIIGESSRRSSWSLYGYHRNTNAFLEHEFESHPGNFMLFKDYIGTAQTTYPSLMSILSVMPSKDFMEIPKHPSFVIILKNATYKTYFLSTYGNIFKTFTNADEEIITNTGYDTDLLPVLRKILADPEQGKKLIVLHLRGSHLALSDYKFNLTDYISSSGSRYLDRYDNSLLHTDLFLHDIAEMVMEEEKEPICVWYLPDHGEVINDFGDGNYGHGCSGFKRYEIELPSLIFFNDAFSAINPKIKTVFENRISMTSHSNVSHTIMGLCGVYPKEYKAKYDLSSPKFTYEEPYLIDVDLFPIRYSKAEIE
jgi:glucan phosphoethanolaminetransferase (alkaline phosphatase superfamily)